MTKSFKDMGSLASALTSLPQENESARIGAQDRNGQLTKPPGALGRLEDLAQWYAAWRGTDKPQLEAPQVIVFAGNHGVAARGVSAFPPEVTVQMVANFAHGGAAINQLSRAFGAKMDVVPLELERPTDDFTMGPAMSEDDFLAAFNAGLAAVDPNADLLVTGEMGIGNTTSASAIACALYGGTADEWVGRGTGVDDEGLARKSEVVSAGLAANPGAIGNGLEALRCLGGRELAGMAGAIVGARMHAIPVILDGFICCAAAATLEAACPGALDHCVAGHQSAEGAHVRILQQIDKAPLLNLGLRLGEGSGGALAIGVLKGAIACHSGMATFAEAGVAAG